MNTSKALAMFAVSTVGMLIFAVLYFSTPNAKTVGDGETHFVTNIVVRTLVNNYTNEVEKVVQVPADIPVIYQTAMVVFSEMTNAQIVDMDKVLFRMKDVSVNCITDDNVPQLLPLDQIKARFELTLRRNGVPINAESLNIVNLRVTGFFNDGKSILCYAVTCELFEKQYVYRDDKFVQAVVRIWSKNGSYGTVGRDKASSALLDEVEKCGEVFANDYLTANPK